jgi:diacylglycerol kinase family enzyme
MKHIFLINSYTVKDDVDKLKEKIKEYCKLNKIDYKIEVNGNGLETEDILDNYQDTKYIIHAIGGDGIINRTLNKLINTKNILSFIPYGTGNDFYKTVQKQFKIGNNKCDAIKINDKYFINTACFGIDADVANNKNMIKASWIPKASKYTLALLYTFFKYKCRNFEVKVENKEINKYFATIAICNGDYYGGGYNIGPSSNLTDGKFEVYLVPKLNKISMIKLILSMKKGKHENSKRLEKITTDKILIKSPITFTCNIDGEKLEGNEFDIKLVPNAITIYYNEDLIQHLKKD